MNYGHSHIWPWRPSTSSGARTVKEQAAASQKVADLAADKRAKARRAEFKVIQGGRA